MPAVSTRAPGRTVTRQGVVARVVVITGVVLVVQRRFPLTVVRPAICPWQGPRLRAAARRPADRRIRHWLATMAACPTRQCCSVSCRWMSDVDIRWTTTHSAASHPPRAALHPARPAPVTNFMIYFLLLYLLECYTGWAKKRATLLCPYLCQLLIYFQNSFTGTLCRQFANQLFSTRGQPPAICTHCIA